jgi:hypothetical protein
MKILLKVLSIILVLHSACTHSFATSEATSDALITGKAPSSLIGRVHLASAPCCEEYGYTGAQLLFEVIDQESISGPIKFLWRATVNIEIGKSSFEKVEALSGIVRLKDIFVKYHTSDSTYMREYAAMGVSNGSSVPSDSEGILKYGNGYDGIRNDAGKRILMSWDLPGTITIADIISKINSLRLKSDGPFPDFTFLGYRAYEKHPTKVVNCWTFAMSLLDKFGINVKAFDDLLSPRSFIAQYVDDTYLKDDYSDHPVIDVAPTYKFRKWWRGSPIIPGEEVALDHVKAPRVLGASGPKIIECLYLMKHLHGGIANMARIQHDFSYFTNQRFDDLDWKIAQALAS